MNWYRLIKISMPVVQRPPGLEYTHIGHENYDSDWDVNPNPIPPEEDTNFVWIMHPNFAVEMQPAGNMSHSGHYEGGNFIASGRYDGRNVSVSININSRPEGDRFEVNGRFMSPWAYKKLVLQVANVLEKRFPDANIMFFDSSASTIISDERQAFAASAKDRGVPLRRTPQPMPDVTVDVPIQDIIAQIGSRDLRGIWDGQHTYWWPAFNHTHVEVSWAMDLDLTATVSIMGFRRRDNAQKIYEYRQEGNFPHGAELKVAVEKINSIIQRNNAMGVKV